MKADSSEFRNNHYVPVWYQRRFLPAGHSSFHVLDLAPDRHANSRGQIFASRSRHILGPKKLFLEKDLYTTRFGAFLSTEIERVFFGRVDRVAGRTFEYWSNFDHSDYDSELFEAFLTAASLQKLRTPKGLRWLRAAIKASSGNDVLFAMQGMQNMHCAHLVGSDLGSCRRSSRRPRFLAVRSPGDGLQQGVLPGVVILR